MKRSRSRSLVKFDLLVVRTLKMTLQDYFGAQARSEVEFRMLCSERIVYIEVFLYMIFYSAKSGFGTP